MMTKLRRLSLTPQAEGRRRRRRPADREMSKQLVDGEIEAFHSGAAEHKRQDTRQQQVLDNFQDDT